MPYRSDFPDSSHASRLSVLIPLMEHPERAGPLDPLARSARVGASDALHEMDELIRLGLAMELPGGPGHSLYRLSDNPAAHRVAPEFRRNRALFLVATSALCDAFLRGAAPSLLPSPHPSPAG